MSPGKVWDDAAELDAFAEGERATMGRALIGAIRGGADALAQLIPDLLTCLVLMELRRVEMESILHNHGDTADGGPDQGTVVVPGRDDQCASPSIVVPTLNRDAEKEQWRSVNGDHGDLIVCDSVRVIDIIIGAVLIIGAILIIVVVIIVIIVVPA